MPRIQFPQNVLQEAFILLAFFEGDPGKNATVLEWLLYPDAIRLSWAISM
jgi:hypothetical protein